MKKLEGLTKEDKELLIAVLEGANPKETNTIKEIRMIDKICTAFEAEGDVDLEDRDYEFLKQRIERFPGWVGTARKDIIRIADLIGV